jgi:hypothetical protein
VSIAEKSRDEEMRQRYAEFKGSKGFLWRFKKRHKISRRAVNSLVKKPLEAQKEAITKFYTQLDSYIEKNGIKTLFNFDETAIFFEIQRDYTLERNGVKHVGVISSGQSKQRLTAICGVASNGLKLPLILILKTQSEDNQNKVVELTPRYFDPETRRLVRRSGTLVLQNAKAWNNSTLMKDHIIPFYVRSLPKVKTLFLMDNCTAHSSSELVTYYESIRKHTIFDYKFLPPDTTPLLQPFDVTIAKAFKSRVRHYFHEYVLNNLLEIEKQNGKKKLTFRNPNRNDIISWAITAWNEIDPSLARTSNCSKLKHYSQFLGFLDCGMSVDSHEVQEKRLEIQTKKLACYTYDEADYDFLHPLRPDDDVPVDSDSDTE